MAAEVEYAFTKDCLLMPGAIQSIIFTADYAKRGEMSG
jgi:hypothetical protein